MATTSYDSNGQLLIDGRPAGSPEANASLDKGGNGFKTPWGSIHGGDIMNWMKKKNYPQIGANPYQGGMDSLIGQLQQQASGKGPSLAENAYRQAHAQGLQDQQSMAAGGSAGQARQAGLNTARLTQGLAAGSSNARLQEQMAAQQSLQQALTGAGNMWFQPQQANLQSQLGAKANWEKTLGGAGDIAKFLAMLG